MRTNAALGRSQGDAADPVFDSQDALYPRSFAYPPQTTDAYLGDPAIRRLAEFFQAKGLAALKDEDRNELWYQDWIDYQARHRVYASLLSPKEYSTLGFEFNLLTVTRFLEVFAYFSPAHGYSLQTTFLGLFAILMGSNSDLKREAVAALEAGGLLGFGVSERDHGSDLLGNEFTVREVGPGRFVANGSKYYIGNSNCASIISILARKDDARSDGRRPTRAPIALFALRPKQSTGFRNLRKIRTLGVRAAFVGEFDVSNHEVPQSDFIAEGRHAWDAVFGTVTLGKFFLGFGSIGICEHALEEAIAHLGQRILYRRSALEMPHIRMATAHAYARLTAMKLHAYRALDYVHVACATDRRYLLFCTVQKAKISTEGVKVIAQLSECVGAKGFESETYFESALRDIQLIPGLEGSTHINLGQTVQFMPRYFAQTDPGLVDPASLTAGRAKPGENPYLSVAISGAVNDVAFSHFLKAYEPLLHVPTVLQFSRQVTVFQSLIQEGERTGIAGWQLRSGSGDSRLAMSCGRCMATIAYAQLIAENAQRLGVATPMISAIFHLLIIDLSVAGQELAALPELDMRCRRLARRLVAIPKSIESDWSFVADRVSALSRQASVSQSVAGKGEPNGRIPRSGGSVSGDRALSPEAGHPIPSVAPEASFLWEFLRVPTRILAWLLFDLKVYGRRHVPKTGGVLIICNHQSNLDPVLVAVRLDRPLNYIAKSQLFHRRFARWLLRSLNSFPVRQGKGDVGAVKETIRRLQQGHVVNLYPEGQRTPDGRIQPLQKGVALIIRRANVPVVPAAVIGTYEAWPIHRRFLRPAPVRIRFGAPLDPARLQSEDEIITAIDHELRRMFAQMQRRFAPPNIQPAESLPVIAPAE